MNALLTADLYRRTPEDRLRLVEQWIEKHSMNDLDRLISSVNSLRRVFAVEVDALRVGPVFTRGRVTKEFCRMATFVIQNDEEIDLTFSPVNKVGQAAPVDGVPAWTATPDAVDIVTSVDGRSAVVKSRDGVTGTVTISVLADADLGDGVRTLTSSCDLVVDQSDAEGAVLSAGEPRART